MCAIHFFQVIIKEIWIELMATEGNFSVDKVLFCLINNKLKSIQGGFYEEGSVSGLSL